MRNLKIVLLLVLMVCPLKYISAKASVVNTIKKNFQTRNKHLKKSHDEFVDIDSFGAKANDNTFDN